MLYCSPVWCSFTDAREQGALEGIIRKLVRLDFLPLSTLTFEVLCNKTDSNLSACILNNNSCYVLHKLLPPIRITRYSMCPRSHNRELPVFVYLSKKCFLTRMLYKSSCFLYTPGHLNFTFLPYLPEPILAPFSRFSITVSSS